MSSSTSNERRRENNRRWRERNPELARERDRANMRKFQHGITLADKAAMLETQGGCCYLCGDEIMMETAVIEHDHRCCPPARSCRYCRRGLACQPCNKMIGMAADDPARLRRIANSLEIALKLADERLRGKPEQLGLL